MDILEQNHEIIDIKTTYGMLFGQITESEELASKIKESKKDKLLARLIASESSSKVNKLMKPKGIIITDTVNHIMYPISNPKIDTSKFDLPIVQRHFQEYTGTNMVYLPWHFTIDFIKSKYYIFNTRPIDMKFPIVTKYWKEKIDSDDLPLNARTHKFFERAPFPIENAIHVAIIGDSNKDLYTRKLYELLGRNCIGPILRYFKLPGKMWQKTYALNMGKKFKTTTLNSFLTR